MVGIACVSVYYTNGLVFDPLDMNFGVVSFNTKYSDQACVCVCDYVCMAAAWAHATNETPKTFSIFEHMKIMWKWTIWHRSCSLSLSIHLRLSLDMYTVCMQFKRMAGFHSQFLSHTLSLSLSHTHASTLDARLSHATLYMYSVCMLFNALMYIII